MKSQSQLSISRKRATTTHHHNSHRRRISSATISIAHSNNNYNNNNNNRLSSVRRSKANARERNRMHQLNDAFDNLRYHIPIRQEQRRRQQRRITAVTTSSAILVPEYDSRTTYESHSSSRSCDGGEEHQKDSRSGGRCSGETSATVEIYQHKLSKIETLRLAKNYIATLAWLCADSENRLSHNELLDQLMFRCSQTTVNLLKTQLWMDGSLCENIITKTNSVDGNDDVVVGAIKDCTVGDDDDSELKDINDFMGTVDK